MNCVPITDFTIEPPTEVVYDTSTRIVEFKSPSTYYCAHVETYNNRWYTYEECAPTTGGSVKISDNVIAEKLRVSLCLDRRPLEICSDPVLAEMCK